MAVSPISSYNTTRITGLSSGMDTDSLVAKLMQSEQSKVDRLYKANTKLTWTKEAYTDVNTKLSALRNKYISASSASSVWSYGTYKSFKVNMADNIYVGIKGTQDAFASSHSISKVQLAASATLNGAKQRNRAASAQGDLAINSLASVTGNKEINMSGPMQLDQLEYVGGAKVFDNLQTDQKIAFTVNGQSFSFNQTDTLDKVMSTVNARTAANVTMSVDSDGLINFKNTQAGPNAKMVLGNVNGSPSVFGVNGAFGVNGGTTVAKNIVTADMTLQQIEDATGRKLGFYHNEISFEINGETFTFGRHDTLQDVLDTVNGNTDANVTLSYDVIGEKAAFNLRSNISGTGTELSFKNIQGNFFATEDNRGFTGIADDQEITDFGVITQKTDTILTAAQKMGVNLGLGSDGMFRFLINGKNFSFDASKTTIESMVKKVNNSDAGVTMSYSQITDSFVIKSNETGKEAKIETANNGNINAFGANSFFGNADLSATGTNALIEIDGETVERSSNNFVLDGIEFNLKVNFDASAQGVNNIDFSLEQDIDGTVEKVKAFITEYNALVKELNDLIREEVDFDYEPLSQAEKESVSSEDLENWNAEAKKGILRNDPTITKLLSDMRSALFEAVGDTGLSAHDIGLTTGSWDSYGQISFNEDKFREMLKSDPDAVAKVMTNVSSSSDTTTVYKESGLLSRFFDQISGAENTIRNTLIKQTDEKINNNDDKMVDMLSKMYEMEERYYLQFAQMETLLSQYQQQSSWLTQQLASLTGSAS
ncbi:MAG: flagellar filament capping protein FliD [Christensenellaceae bacterium]|jgi:flagellar hook-associated protein 2